MEWSTMELKETGHCQTRLVKMFAIDSRNISQELQSVVGATRFMWGTTMAARSGTNATSLVPLYLLHKAFAIRSHFT